MWNGITHLNFSRSTHLPELGYMDDQQCEAAILASAHSTKQTRLKKPSKFTNNNFLPPPPPPQA